MVDCVSMSKRLQPTNLGFLSVLPGSWNHWQKNSFFLSKQLKFVYVYVMFVPSTFSKYSKLHLEAVWPSFSGGIYTKNEHASRVVRSLMCCVRNDCSCLLVTVTFFLNASLLNTAYKYNRNQARAAWPVKTILGNKVGLMVLLWQRVQIRNRVDIGKCCEMPEG